jgi:hypothetical protein
MLIGDVNFVIYRGITKTHWMPPHDNETISPEKKKQIFERLDEYMKENRIRYEIED